MKKKTTRFLIISLILVSILCVIVFVTQTIRMNQKGAETIGEIGEVYMSGMSEQATRHFGTIMDLRLAQVAGLADTVPADGSVSSSSMHVNLTYHARSRGFDYLALCAPDGTIEMLYGNDIVEVDDLEGFRESLQDGEQKITIGMDELGENVVLMGIPAAYPMGDGSRCVGLIAGLPANYIRDTLSLNMDESTDYYFIIRKNGDFIIHDESLEDANYFTRVENKYTDVGGKTPEQFIEELKAAIAKDETYSTQFTIFGEDRRYLYATSLPSSDLYLLMFMPYGQVNQAIVQLGDMWTRTAIFNCIIILAALILVFYWYFHLLRQKMREMEEAREAAEYANRAKSEFLSNMSHDIRTPMNGIVGMTALASSNPEDTQQVRNCLRKITLSSRHLLGLVNDILDMSKIESGKMTLNVEQVSLHDVMQGIADIIQPQTYEKKQRFDVYLYDIFAENVFCDSVRLNQVLMNLLGNAVKFTPEGGSIRVTLYEEESPLGDGYVRVHFRIRDNGIGMSREFQQKVFESFAREDNTRVQKTEGTGLGMAITKYIVDAMHGTIEVESEKGRGTEFHVTLDFERATVQGVEMKLPAWEVLIIDDDEMLCESAAATFKTLGVRADCVRDGETALRIIRERHENRRDFDVILVDWKMEKMDGIETVRRIREICGRKLPIVLISACDWEEVAEQAQEAGVDALIGKPLFSSNLYYTLRQFSDEELAQEVQEDGGKGLLEGRHILFAEDNDLNWEIADGLLSEYGLQLDRAENGKECVELFEKSEEGYYDAILMDIRMPVMTGYEAAEAIRALNRRDAAAIPIIAQSADAFSDDIRKCLDAGMNAHVAKPIDVQEIMRQLRKFVIHEG